MKKILLIILFAAVLVGGSFFVQQTVFAQAIGGKITYFGFGPEACNPLSPLFPTCGRHTILGIRPSIYPGVICPFCQGIAGIGRWFLGRAVGGIITIGGLGGF